MMKFIRIVSVIALISVMAVIFMFSSQDADASGNASDCFTAKIITFFYPEFAEKSFLEQTIILDKFSLPIRKFAHFTLYFCLGISAYCTLITYVKIPFHLKIALPAVYCILYAISDEYHQTFVNGRSGELRDVLIDSAASVIAVIVMLLVFRFKKRKKNTN